MNNNMEFEEKYLVRNAAICNSCEDYTESNHRHDYVVCSCGKIAVDGGHEYAKRTGGKESYTDVSVWTRDLLVARHLLKWGGRGKDGRSAVKWVPISKMATSHIEAILNNLTSIDPNYKMCFENELKIRNKDGK